jgi:hypothetical protein
MMKSDNFLGAKGAAKPEARGRASRVVQLEKPSAESAIQPAGSSTASVDGINRHLS